MRKTEPQRFPKLFAAIAAIALFAGCSSPPASNNTASSPTAASPAASTATADKKGLKDIRVQLAFLMQSIDAPLIVAINKGYFAEQGLNVSYERGFGNADTISKLATGKFDLAFSDMYNALDFNDKNPKDKLIAVAITQNAAPFSILTLKGSGINSPKDLSGKKLGAPAGEGPRKLFPLFAKERKLNKIHNLG